MARSQEIRDAIAAHLGTVSFGVSVAIKKQSLSFAEVDLHQFPTVYVSEMQHERETRITRVHTRKGYKIACVVAGFINE